MTGHRSHPLGASPLPDIRWRFLVFAPSAGTVEVRLLSPGERVVLLERDDLGYHHGIVDGVKAGARYLYRLDGGKDLPDPASRFQPEGVHGPSMVIDPDAFSWTDLEWRGIPLSSYILYELHVGTYTPEGTLDAIIPRLDSLAELGITALELMPVSQFPGKRNWGYDGVYPFAVQESYGGPDGLKRLVDACHRRGLAVVLDVVYSHLGPEGNYLSGFGPYFNDRYHTPWGAAVNFDGPHSDEVRRYFLENALRWLQEFHVDALRLDAIHGIMDFSASPFLSELAGAVRDLRKEEGRMMYLIAESDLNDARIVTPRDEGGYGLDAQWSDDFHHALHTLLTGEREGYYEDFGGIGHLGRAFTDGFVYSGQYSAYRKRRHGNPSRHLPAGKFVVFAQNHDQVGNRLRGARLARLVGFESLKLAAGVVLLSPFLPLLFMGEEYGEVAPFLYFVHHGDEGLIEAVRKGRKEEFADFGWMGEIPDPQDENTFLRSRPDPALRESGNHVRLLAFHRELIRIRKTDPVLSRTDREGMEVSSFEKENALVVLRRNGPAQAAAVFHFGDAPATLPLSLPVGRWGKVLDSSDARWGGPGGADPERQDPDEGIVCALRPHSFLLLTNSGKENR
ncbi:MAG TPA: malto-oligosyltrehalose trehalohydrolase [Candidatus Deferrimicrobiaceae bacterium]|nr:malto-oligosyltrehalose trehalohydrolase [Candidatus Deferrimicrobiaceae bacterium]